MRVLMLHLFDLDLTGGSGTHLRAVRSELLELGHEVEVVSARTPDRFGATTHALPFGFTPTFGPEIRPGERRLDDLGDDEFEDLAARTAAALTARYASCQPDLVLVNHVSLLAAVAMRLPQHWRAPYRVISFGTDTDLLRREPRFVRRLAAPAAGAERVFAISGFVAREVEALLPVEGVEVLGAAADRRLFFPGPDGASWEPVITYAGRLVTEKGLFVLIDAMERTRAVERLDIIGEGPLYPALRERLDRTRPPLPIVLVGKLPQEELRRRMASSAAVVVPSTWQEPLALVVAEALACGVPVIATAVGGLTEMVIDGVNGLVVPPGDADALAQALDRVVGDRGFAQELRRSSRERTRVPTYADVAQRLIGDVGAVASMKPPRPSAAG
jgi:glycosyltransferase involved in cell wall biosynthesis